MTHIIESDLGEGWTAQRAIKIDGSEEMRIFKVTQFSPNEQEIILGDKSVKLLREIFNKHS